MGSITDINFRVLVVTTYKKKAGVESILDKQKERVRGLILEAANRGEASVLVPFVPSDAELDVKKAIFVGMINYCTYDLSFKAEVVENGEHTQLHCNMTVDNDMVNKLIVVSGWADEL